MEKVLRDYRSRLQANSRETERIKMYIRIIAFLRLSVVVVAALIVYLFRNEGVEVWGTTVLIGIVLFLSLARVHDRWKKEFVDCRDRIIHRELSLLEYRFDGIDGGSEFIDPSHDYSFDLDLFGERSFFSYINRTATAVGRVALSRELLHPDLKTASIRERQEAVEEMSCHTDFRIDFQSYGGCSGESQVDTEAIERLAGMPRFGTGRIVCWLVYAVPAVYLALFALWLTGMVAGNVIVAVFILLLVLSGLFAKRVTRIQEQLNRTLQSLSRYSRLFEMMERMRFRCKPLSELQSRCVDSDGSVSQRVSRLRHLLSNLDQRYNFVGFALLNGFLLWDLRQINALDRWLCDNCEKITQWIDVLSRFDVYVSLGTFRYNYPDYVFPDIREDRTPVMQAEALGHPLIPREKRVCNDVAPMNEASFQIITGANMAGKR